MINRRGNFGVLSETPVILFENEFMLHILGQEYSFPFPTLMAYASSIGEIILPILVMLGLFTRFAGVGLLLMNVNAHYSIGMHLISRFEILARVSDKLSISRVIDGFDAEDNFQ